ncbi:hypothetical protein [uncultured Methylobacterium sp.]|uniref:hypothetical protein n=1 Tax=uncultured Methylobacterium sp. TaxID=157278 RepID=UPI0035CBF4F6
MPPTRPQPSEFEPGEAVSRDLIVYADRARFDALRVAVRLAYARSDDPPVPVRFTAADDGAPGLRPRAAWAAEPAPCARLRTTDFSLW